MAQNVAGQKSLGTFGSWQTFTYEEANQSVCYMVKPIRFPPPANKKFKRGDAFLMITHRPGENSNDVVSYASGYNFKPASELKITLGKNSFSLFTQKDTAWSREASTDHAISRAIRDNSSLRAVGQPAQNVTAVTDTLDIKGADKAYYAISKACGLEVEMPKKAPEKAKKAPKPVKKQPK